MAFLAPAPQTSDQTGSTRRGVRKQAALVKPRPFHSMSSAPRPLPSGSENLTQKSEPSLSQKPLLLPGQVGWCRLWFGDAWGLTLLPPFSHPGL